MFYSLDVEPIEQNIARQAKRSGEKLPDRIANKPDLKPGLQLYLQAFFDLDAERTHALSLTPIPWTAIKAYVEFYAFDLEQAEDAFILIRKVDNAHLQRLAKKNPS